MFASESRLEFALGSQSGFASVSLSGFELESPLESRLEFALASESASG